MRSFPVHFVIFFSHESKIFCIFIYENAVWCLKMSLFLKKMYLCLERCLAKLLTWNHFQMNSQLEVFKATPQRWIFLSVALQCLFKSTRNKGKINTNSQKSYIEYCGWHFKMWVTGIWLCFLALSYWQPSCVLYVISFYPQTTLDSQH